MCKYGIASRPIIIALIFYRLHAGSIHEWQNLLTVPFPATFSKQPTSYTNFLFLGKSHLVQKRNLLIFTANRQSHHCPLHQHRCCFNKTLLQKYESSSHLCSQDLLKGNCAKNPSAYIEYVQNIHRKTCVQNLDVS